MNTRTDLLNRFIRERGFHGFLEIGTADGANFRAVECEKKVNVDPNAEGAEPAGRLPDVERLTYADFVAHPEWMGFVE